MADTVHRPKDSTDRADSHPGNTLDSLDRNKLLASKGAPTHAGATTEKDLAAKGHLNDDLKKADIYAPQDRSTAASSAPHFEFYQLSKHSLPKDAEAPPASPTDVARPKGADVLSTKGAEIAQPDGTLSPTASTRMFKEIKSDKAMDPKQPTVAFLDDFHKGYIPLNGERLNERPDGLSHGDLSAKAAEQNGFNVIRLQAKDDQPTDVNHQIDFSQSLNEAVKKIDSGALKLGKGDVLNVSLGNNRLRDADGKVIPGSGDPTFEELSARTGLNLNADNIASQKDAVIAKLREISKDPKTPDDVRKAAGVDVATNDAIDELKKRGVHVTFAAGNDGPDRISPGFLNATQLSNRSPDGTMDPTSANNSLTKAEKVPREIKYSGANVFDPTPNAEQQGVYSAVEPSRAPDGTVTEKTVATFPASDFGGIRTDPNSYFLRKDGRYQKWRDPELQFKDEASKLSAYGKDLRKLPKLTPSGDLEKFTSTSADSAYGHLQPLKKGEHLGGHVINLRPSAQSQVDKEAFLKRKTGTGQIVGLTNGTSFSNIGHLGQIKDELIKEKAGQ